EVRKPILLHALLETAQGVMNVEEICGASPRMHGLSLGPADLAASRGMKTTALVVAIHLTASWLILKTASSNEHSFSKTCGTTPSHVWSMPASRMVSVRSTGLSAT